MVAEKTAKMNENRRSNKPIMEKRRRARINSCLNDLKVLILEALKKDPARHSKLEKADILEMTVKHLQSLHRQQLALSTAADPNVANKFRAGFKECATEVTRFLSRTEGLDTGVRDRLVNHLSNCVDGGRVGGGVYAPHPHEATAATLQSVNMNTMMTTNCSPPVLNSASTFTNRRLEERSNITTTNATSMGSSASRMTNRLQLYPTRLPNGDFALLLPGNYSLAPYTNNNTSQENFLVNNNGTMSTTEMTVNSNVQSMSSPIPIETPPSIPLNLQSSLSSLHSRFQHSGHPYGGSLRNIPSSTSAIFSGQERELRLGNDQPYYILDEKVKDECQEFTNPDELSSCKDSLVKNDPWRPW